jgi:hypothetical protein
MLEFSLNYTEGNWGIIYPLEITKFCVYKEITNVTDNNTVTENKMHDPF